MTSERVGRAAEEFRAALLARDAAALKLQTRALILVLRHLDARIKALAEAAAALPVRPTRGQLARMEQFLELRAAALAELSAYARSSAGAIAALQGVNIDAAIAESEELVRVQFPRGVTWGTLAAGGVRWVQLDPDALSVLVGRLGDGSPLRTYLERRIIRGTIAQVVDTLTTGIIDNPRVTARALREHFAGGMTQSLRISRTETLRAYRDAARASYEANPSLVRAYRRHEALDNRCCVACWLLDGTLYEVSSAMEEHIQGRGYLSPELVSWRELGFVGVPEPPREPTGRERFAELSEARQREIIGNDRQYELLRSGRISLGDLIQRQESADFGAQLVQASAKASLAGLGTLSQLPSTEFVSPIESLVRLASPVTRPA